MSYLIINKLIKSFYLFMCVMPLLLLFQFVCGLSLCCGTQANLSRDEINSLVNFYQTEDGRVRYKEFCDSMENGEYSEIFSTYVTIIQFIFIKIQLLKLLLIYLIFHLSDKSGLGKFASKVKYHVTMISSISIQFHFIHSIQP